MSNKNMKYQIQQLSTSVLLTPPTPDVISSSDQEYKVIRAKQQKRRKRKITPNG